MSYTSVGWIMPVTAVSAATHKPTPAEKVSALLKKASGPDETELLRQRLRLVSEKAAQPPSSEKKLPSWVIPAAVGAGVLVLVVVMKS